MENLPSSSSSPTSTPEPKPNNGPTLSAVDTSTDSIVSIAGTHSESYEDLAQTQVVDAGKRTSLLLLVVVVASAAAAYMLMTGCTLTFCSGTTPSASQAKLPTVLETGLAPLDIEIATLYSGLPDDVPVFSEKYKLKAYEDLEIIFYSPSLLTPYSVGNQSFLATRYVDNGSAFEVSFPYAPEEQLLFSNGSVSVKPYFTSYEDLLQTTAFGKKITFGLLTGSFKNDYEKTVCQSQANLCTMIDMYSKNRVQVDDLLDVNTPNESTVSMNLPIYFVGVK